MSSKKLGKASDVEEQMDEQELVDSSDYQCGVFSWRPTYLQKFVGPVYFTLVYLLYGIFQGAMKTGLNSSMTTIERKFGMSGKMISVVMTMDNVTGTLTCLIVGYYATKISRPKILVFGVWMSVLGCFFFVLPHLVYGGVGVDTNLLKTPEGFVTRGRFTEFCRQGNQVGSNDSLIQSTSTDAFSVALPVQILFSVGNMMNGIGGTAFFIAGVSYTDDNVKKKNSPVYFGAILSLRMLGPLLGVMVNSIFLTINEHPFNPPSGMSIRDPRWIGAWWLPFAGWGILMSFVSIPLLLFPKRIRRAPMQAKTPSAAPRAPAKTVPESLWRRIMMDMKDFGSGLKRLSRNRVFTWKCLGYVFIMNGVGGLMMNLPKYIETQYRVSAAKASFLAGSTKALPMILAIIAGGVATRIFRPSARAICFWAVAADVLNIAAMITAIHLPCNNWKLGETSYSEDGSLTLLSQCNEFCACSREFQPFCDRATNQSYYSPCYGGCFGSNLTSMDCRCSESQDQIDSAAGSSLIGTARYAGGFCRNDCINMTIFIWITTVAEFLSCLPTVGCMLVDLRCVEPTDKSLALGVTGFALGVFGALPYPLIYGALFDSTCLIWGGHDGTPGNCWYYNNDVLRYRFLGVTVAFYILANMCFTMMGYYAKNVGDLYEDDTEADEGSVDAETENQRMNPRTNRP